MCAGQHSGRKVAPEMSDAGSTCEEQDSAAPSLGDNAAPFLGDNAGDNASFPSLSPASITPLVNGSPHPSKEVVAPSAPDRCSPARADVARADVTPGPVCRSLSVSVIVGYPGEGEGPRPAVIHRTMAGPTGWCLRMPFGLAAAKLARPRSFSLPAAGAGTGGWRPSLGGTGGGTAGIPVTVHMRGGATAVKFFQLKIPRELGKLDAHRRLPGRGWAAASAPPPDRLAPGPSNGGRRCQAPVVCRALCCTPGGAATEASCGASGPDDVATAADDDNPDSRTGDGGGHRRPRP